MRMDVQLKRGLLEICVLAAIRDEESYGYRIIKDIQPFMEISESTLYPILRRLEENGALTVHSAEHNGRLRKYYAITDTGKERIKQFTSEWDEMIRVYKFITKEEGELEHIEVSGQKSVHTTSGDISYGDRTNKNSD